MIIMMIAPGRSIHSNNWASAMCDRGHVVHFVTQESFTHNKYSFVEYVDSRFIIHQLPFKSKLGFVLNSLYVNKLTKEIDPDVIHVQQAAGYGLLGTFSDRSKAFVSVYGWEVYDKVNSKIWKPIVSYILHWYKHIGSTSYCMKKQIQKVFPDIKTPIVVTPFGIDTEKFSYIPTNKDEIIVGIVKKMSKVYGIEYLIEAFKQTLTYFEKTCPEISNKLYLELVGPGEQVDEFKNLVAEMGICDKVRFIGRVPHEDVPKWLSRFDVYVAPSISESFGVAVIEASACKRAVVVSDVGGLPEVVDDGITGYIVPAKDPDALSQKIKKLILDDSLREQMGEAGEKLVKERYEWAYCVDLMEEVYQSIIDKTYSNKIK